MIDWITENGLTPYLVVQAGEGVQVPQSYVTEGRIVLNVSPVAVRDFSVTNEYVMFDGRFGGKSFPVSAPMHACVAVYAKESGEGMLFEAEYPAKMQPNSPVDPAGSVEADDVAGGKSSSTPKDPKRRGHLTTVK